MKTLSKAKLPVRPSCCLAPTGSRNLPAGGFSPAKDWGGGSTPVPDDPAVTNPLGHLDDLPGMSESPPTPGAGLPDEVVPAPEPPAPPPARILAKSPGPNKGD